MSARYDRAPSPSLVQLLLPGGLLAPLLRPRRVAGLPLDLQFREGDEVHLYCGLTRLVTARLGVRGVRLRAAETYARQPCAVGLFRTWQPDELGLDAALDAYLSSVIVHARWTDREGAVQAAWMGVMCPWTTLDREAVIGRSSTDARSDALEAPAVRDAFEAVDALARARGWRRPASPKGANELDQLAVDPQGQLVLVELKAARAPDVVTAPLQALRYVWEWHEALSSLLPALAAISAARRELGLLPSDTPQLTGALRAAVAWGEGQPSAEVLDRMHAVKAVVDPRLPAEVGEIEVWSLTGGEPQRLA